MTASVERFDPKRVGGVASNVAKKHFPHDRGLRTALRSPDWNFAALHLRYYPLNLQASFFQAFFERRSVQMPNGGRLARFLVALNNPGQPLSMAPDQTTDPAQLVSEYFQNIGHPPMQRVQIVQSLSEVEGEDIREVVVKTLGPTEHQLYDTARAQQHAEALTFILNLSGKVTDSSIYFWGIDIGSQRFMRRYAAICGGAIMVQALAPDKQDPSFTIEPLITLHERGYLLLGPVLAKAEQQPFWRRLLSVGPSRQSTFMLLQTPRAK